MDISYEILERNENQEAVHILYWPRPGDEVYIPHKTYYHDGEKFYKMDEDSFQIGEYQFEEDYDYFTYEPLKVGIVSMDVRLNKNEMIPISICYVGFVGKRLKAGCLELRGFWENNSACYFLTSEECAEHCKNLNKDLETLASE